MGMKKGVIRISNEVYNDCWIAVADIFKEFKPNHIEFRHWENDLWYFYGTSESFDIVNEGEIIPFYEVLFDTVNKTYSFKKQ